MPRSAASQLDTSIQAYRTKRDFAATSEPQAEVAPQGRSHAPIFVVQKHKARGAGLHWDFRLEHNDVLWSWAVRKGPSLDPADKRIAVHVEDHPLDYANFHGDIPEGSYGAGSVEIWDHGTWAPLVDPDDGMHDGEIKFTLSGKRLNGKFTLVRLKPKPNQRGRQDNWLLIKGHDSQERAGADAAALEAAAAPPADVRDLALQGAVRGKLPVKQAPQLATVVESPPEGDGWVTEIKFDGYRLLAFIDHGEVRVLTRNGNDWTARLPTVVNALRQLRVESALLDGELVALDKDGVSSFPALQAALANEQGQGLAFYLFDLLHLDGWDCRRCTLLDRKRQLNGLGDWSGALRYSDHHEGDAARIRNAACRMKLEGVICKKADAPYHSGRGADWLKVKCQGREEFIVLGWTEPEGSRTGLGALHVGYYDSHGNLHYAGGVGSGFSDGSLQTLRDRLDGLAAKPPRGLLVAGEELERIIHWVRPELVAETSFTAWSGAGRVRHGVFLGLREDKGAKDVVRDPADPAAERRAVDPMAHRGGAARKKLVGAAPVTHEPARASVIVTARAPRSRAETIEGVTLTHPDKALWPGVTKRDLALYWQAVAPHALPGLAKRPLAILRCPDGAGGEKFFQKHPHGAMPSEIREGVADKAPFLAIDGVQGLVAMAQMSAVELHAWGATEADPLHPDQLVFDLDPGEGVTVPEIVAAALDVRAKLEAIGLAAFCRTSGGKGLHVVAPLRPERPWEEARIFCKDFAERLSAASPEKYLAHVKVADRRGRILIDWLRNGLGSTAIASFSPRARPGAGVATPLAWKEVAPKLALDGFDIRTTPRRLAKLRGDPWADFEKMRQTLPSLPESEPEAKREAVGRLVGKARIVTAKAPKPRVRKA